MPITDHSKIQHLAGPLAVTLCQRLDGAVASAAVQLTRFAGWELPAP